MIPGYWASTYWDIGYWDENYWADYLAVTSVTFVYAVSVMGEFSITASVMGKF